MSSKAQAIIDNVITVLRAINGPATYQNTIPTSDHPDIQPVEANDRDFGSIPDDQFPHFNVIFMQENRVQEPSFLKVELELEIRATFKGSSETEIASWISDVEIALKQDIQRGQTYVHNSWIPSVKRDSGVNQPFRIILIDVLIIYTFPWGSP